MSVGAARAGIESIEPPDAVLYAVLDDIRNTLGVAWLDPTFRAIATDPLFVIAAWSATRPNVTKSFAESASRLRKAAMEHVRGLDPPDHLSSLEHDLRQPEMIDVSQRKPG